eukprot:6211194-Pleurochrysis_carterae.AAC.1
MTSKGMSCYAGILKILTLENFASEEALKLILGFVKLGYCISSLVGLRNAATESLRSAVQARGHGDEVLWRYPNKAQYKVRAYATASTSRWRPALPRRSTTSVAADRLRI